jgi:hypothetical protein
MSGQTVLLVNASGREVLSSKMTATGLIIDMTPFPAGTYLIRTANESQQSVIKIIKQ